MIIIGYQGIGKSTLAGQENFIDLESSNFWHNGSRPDNWYVFYCQIADSLSKQGYTVFVSSHEVVRNRLRKYSKEQLFIVCPSVDLKEEWIDRLKQRFESTKLDKDYKDWVNAEERYEENINELITDSIPTYQISSMDYKLKNIVLMLKNGYSTQEVKTRWKNACDIFPGEWVGTYHEAELSKELEVGDKVKVIVDSQFNDYDTQGTYLPRAYGLIGVVADIDDSDEWRYCVVFDEDNDNWFKRYHLEKVNMEDAIFSFDGEYDFLSNFHEVPVEFDGLLYMNSEAAYQAQKTLDEKDRFRFTEYKPGKAKREGKKIKIREDWDEIKNTIMYEVCLSKFSQNRELLIKLLNTNQRYLEEGNDWCDNYWGNCSCEECKDKIGKNMLGQILMTIRSELSNEIFSKKVV